MYIKNRNVGELYYLIDDSLHHKGSFEKIKSLDIIAKMILLDNEIPENRFAVNGLHILLIDGLEKTKKFTS